MINHSCSQWSDRFVHVMLINSRRRCLYIWLTFPERMHIVHTGPNIWTTDSRRQERACCCLLQSYCSALLHAGRIKISCSSSKIRSISVLIWSSSMHQAQGSGTFLEFPRDVHTRLAPRSFIRCKLLVYQWSIELPFKLYCLQRKLISPLAPESPS